MHADRRPVRRDDAPRQRATDGIAIIARTPALRSILVLVISMMLALGVANVAEIYFTVSVLHAGAAAYGAIGLVFGAGTFLVSAASARIAERVRRPEVLFVTGCATLSVALVAFGLSRSLVAAMVCVAILGGANALVNVNASVIFAAAAPADVRGRVFATIQGSISAVSVASLALGGVLLGVLDPSVVIVGGAIGAGVALLATMRPVLALERVLVDA
jgi:Na+/melibiose symporter-like transporter